MAIAEAAPASSASTSSSSRPRRRRRPPEVLTEPEAIALIRACSSRAPTGIRNRALIAVLWRSGLRISEALALELRDLDLQAGSLRVRHGKGDKSRTVGVDEQTAALLARWLDSRRRLSPGARAPVFCTLAGGRVDPSYVRHLLPRLARKAGIDRRVHAHGLRHTYASELARERTPINVIRDALGHTSLAVTDRYLRDVAPMHVIDTIRARSWVGA
jgi:site-specific recombinase XerD